MVIPAIVFYLVVLVIILVFLYYAWKLFKELIINTVLGLIILAVGYYLLGIEFNSLPMWLAILISAVFGVPGALIILILGFFGII